MKMQYQQKCDICGQMFMPRSSRQHYCSKIITRVCAICNEDFETKCSPDGTWVCNKPECKKLGRNIGSPVEKICKGCGCSFVTQVHNQVYCNKEREKECPVCHKMFKYVCNSNSTECCSTECSGKLPTLRRIENAHKMIKICKWCGKEFIPNESKEVYCEGPHFKLCAICGKEFEIDVRSHTGVSTCSKECMGKLMSQNHDYAKGIETLKQVLLNKYGVDSPIKIPGVIDKMKQTSLERYGVEWYAQTEEHKQRIKETSLNKYGTEHYLQSNEVIAKRIETCKEKYGVENVFQADEIKLKSKETNIAKYGVEHASQSEEIKNIVRANNLHKYGVEHPMMLKEFRDKAIATNLERYGRAAYTQQHIANIENWYLFINDPRGYIESHYTTAPRAEQIATDLGVDRTTIDVYLSRTDSFDCVRRAKSLMEDELQEFILSLNANIRIVRNNKTTIHPYELDLYLPDFNFAIECNPTCTHNSSVSDPWGGEPKSHNYHKRKTDLCEEKGIQLFHIFGYDWTKDKRPIILSMIASKLNCNKNRIYARNCKVVEVSGSDAINFLDANHRQGGASSPIRLGLEHNGQLVSLMTFGKMRNTIGTDSTNLDDCWELVRFCSLLNTSVVGGASKLFKHFTAHYTPKRIRSFSDRAHTSGELYKILRFNEIRLSEPGYVWVNVASDKAFHRANAQKKNIRKFLNDENIDLSKTEKEIMIEHGYVQVFDSGVIVWEWCCK